MGKGFMFVVATHVYFWVSTNCIGGELQRFIFIPRGNLTRGETIHYWLPHTATMTEAFTFLSELAKHKNKSPNLFQKEYD